MKLPKAKKPKSDQLFSGTLDKIFARRNGKTFLSFVIIFLVLAIILITALLCAGPATTPKDFLKIVRAVNDTAYDVLKGNRMTAKVEGNEKIFTFTTPSRIKEKDSHLDYAGKSWLWDSCFHVMILAEEEPEVAKDELRSVCAHQREDGFIPHMNYWEGDGKVPPEWAKKKGLKKFWSKKYSSDITQPPILALALKEIYDQTKGIDYLEEMLPKLEKYYDYLHDKRDPEKDSLISILHPWESGWDNSQRWDPVLGIPRNKGSVKRSDIDEKKIAVFISNVNNGWDEAHIFDEDKFTVEPVDFNVLYCLNIEILSDLFSEIGDDDKARKFSKRMEATREAIFSKMWDDDNYMYVDLFGKDDEMSEIKAASMFYPMMLDGEKHFEQLIEKHLLNPKEFASPYGIPTTSRDDPTYDPDAYWRGNIWHNVNYFVVRGLNKVYQEHGFSPAEKAKIYIIISSYITLYRGGSSEYFNPETGKGYGVKSFGWNGIVRKMFSLRQTGINNYGRALAVSSGFYIKVFGPCLKTDELTATA
jgi:glycogen debranching enzyme